MKPRIPYTKPSITELESATPPTRRRTAGGEHCYDYILRFEEAFKTHLGVGYAIATSSCTGALHMGMATSTSGRVTKSSWPTPTGSPAPRPSCAGAKPVFVDILPNSWCWTRRWSNRPSRLVPRPSSRFTCTAISARWTNCSRLASGMASRSSRGCGGGHRLGLPRPACRFDGPIRRVSFGTKTLTTDEGGMFVTNDADLYEVGADAQQPRPRGQTKQFWPDVVGFKYKINIQAAIGCAQLERINRLVNRKGDTRVLQGAAGTTPRRQMNPEPPGTINGAWMPTVVFNHSVASRARCFKRCSLRRTSMQVFFYPLSGLPPFRKEQHQSAGHQYSRARGQSSQLS